MKIESGPEQEKVNIGLMISDLLRLYANPEDSKAHAVIAD